MRGSHRLRRRGDTLAGPHQEREKKLQFAFQTVRQEKRMMAEPVELSRAVLYLVCGGGRQAQVYEHDEFDTTTGFRRLVAPLLETVESEVFLAEAVNRGPLEREVAAMRSRGARISSDE
ncbi:unnamed protein product [Prorocentrum cordatum]|uniref:Uncharacterized protein n=1 Tax=Prorocentrum cordatum TaxID=2364126 RepID=A0ABN9RDT9_9DINO|nr:unnamed protein product [Polarella glacialis]